MFEEREINIKNVILTALLKWRKIFCVALIFAVALPFAMYELDAWRNRQEEERMITAEDFNNVNVGALADLYEQYNSLNEQLNQYTKSGVTPGAVKYVYLQYYMKPISTASSGDASDDLLLKMAEKMNADEDDLANLYQNYIMSEEFVGAMMNAVGMEEETIFRQFLNITAEGHNLYIMIPYEKNEDTDAMISIADELVQDKQVDFQVAEEHELKFVSSGKMEGKNSTSVTEQYNLTYERYNINRWISVLQNDLTKEQIAYARHVATGDIIEGEEIPASLLSELEGEEKPEVTIRVTFAVVGAFLGFFLMFAWYVVHYAMSGKLDAVESMTKVAKVRTFETVELPRRKKFCHGIDDKLFYWLHNNKRKLTMEQQVAAIVSAISLYAEQNNVKKICLTSTRFGKLNEDVTEALLKGLANEKLDATLVDDLAYDKTALRACVAADGVVVVEQVGKSVLTEIEKLLKSAGEYKVNVIGSVVLE